MIKKKLKKEIEDFCKLNGLDVEDYTSNLLQLAFTADKFGKTPNPTKKPTKEVVKKVVKEEAEELVVKKGTTRIIKTPNNEKRDIYGEE